MRPSIQKLILISFAIISIFSFAPKAHAAIALVNHTIFATGYNGGTTSAIDTTGANFLVISLSTYEAYATVTSVSDSKGNTWVPLTKHLQAGTNDAVRFWYSKNATVGTGHTFTVAKTTGYIAFEVMAFSGVDTSSPFDVENGNGFTGGGSSLTTGSVTPSQNNSLILVDFTTDIGTTVNSIDSSFSITDKASASPVTTAAAYLIQGTAAAVNPTWSFGSVARAVAGIAVFKPAIPPPPPQIFKRGIIFLRGIIFR